MNAHSRTALYSEELTDPDAAFELAEMEGRFGPTPAQIAQARARQDHMRAVNFKLWGIPQMETVLLPIELAPAAIAAERAHLASLSVERRAELEWGE